MDLLYIWHDYYTCYYRYWYRILFSTIPTLWPRGQGLELRNFMLKFCLKVFKILYLNSWISNQNSIHLAYIWYTASYWRCSSSKIICSTMSSSPLPTLPTPNPSGIILMVIYKLFMPPTSKKLEGHIASGLFVRPSVRPSVRSSCFLMHSITLKPWMLLFWNFIYGFLMKK